MIALLDSYNYTVTDHLTSSFVAVKNYLVFELYNIYAVYIWLMEKLLHWDFHDLWYICCNGNKGNRMATFQILFFF